VPDIPTPGATEPNAENPTENPSTDDPSMDPLLPTTPPAGDGQQETVTVEHGDHKISVTSPDGQGQVTVTVDDGSGTPKTYNLNFGGPDAAVAPAPPTPAPPASGGVPGPIQPGPDGRCVIEDGDLKITAERPAGQADTVLVTVDDGTGEPTSYNLDYSNQYGATSPQATGSLSKDDYGDDGHDVGGEAGLSRANDSQYADIGRPGEAGLSSADDTGGGHAPTGMPGGMPMLGGGGGGGGGEDQQRTSSLWKTTGDLFDDDTDARLSDVFGERR
jgi:hypothetical protein